MVFLICSRWPKNHLFWAIRAEKAKTPKPFDFKPFQPFHCQLCVSRQTVSTWHEEMKLLNHTCAGSREHVHWWLPVRKNASRNISTICLFVRNISTGLGSLPVIGNMSTSYDLLLNYRTKKFKFTADSSCFSNIKLRLYTVPVFLLPATQFPWRYFWPIRTRSRNKV